jgi:hypothetical protein
MLATGPSKYPVSVQESLTHLRLGANHVIHEGKLKKGSFVRLKSYQANAVKGKRFGCLLQLFVGRPLTYIGS